MARRKLSAKAVEQQRRAGYFGDGDGLYLQVTASRSKSWIFRYRFNDRAREMGLGSASVVSLADARDKALDCRRMLADGIDPIDARHAKRNAERLERAKAMTFKQAADGCIEARAPEWRNTKHASQWSTTLAAHVYPVIGLLPVADIDTALVLKVLQPIWQTIPETARRIRSRLEAVIDWATARGYRTGENPARWRGHMQNLLPSMKKRVGVKHHPALPYARVHGFVEQLRKEKGTAARALEFLILTATRTREVTDAKPEEFDLDKATWTVPAERMKAHREHRVPLCPRAVEIVRAQLELNEPYVFAGHSARRPLSSGGMQMVLRRLKARGITVHGMRSTFRDWAAERTSYPSEIAEAALAHTVGDAVERAYRRGDLFDKRRKLMNEWQRFIDTEPATGAVLTMKKRELAEATTT